MPPLTPEAVITFLAGVVASGFANMLLVSRRLAVLETDVQWLKAAVGTDNALSGRKNPKT